MTEDNSGPNMKAKFPFPFFVLIAAVVLFVLYVPMFTRQDVPLPGTEPLLAMEPAELPPNVKTFCARVAAVKQACRTAQLDCSKLRRESYAALLEHARLCSTAPFDISPGNAAVLLQNFRPDALCCFK